MDTRPMYYKSFEELYTDKYKLVFAFILDYKNHFSLRDDEVEEISQMVWVKISEHVAKILTFDEPHVKNYLRITTRNTVFDYAKQKSKYEKNTMGVEESGLYELETSDGVCDRLMYIEDIEILYKAIEKLTIQERELLYMRFNSGMTSYEIATALSMTDVNVRVKQTRILKKLKNTIEILEGGENE